MKKTHFIELLNTIKKTKVAFVSILVFVALGVGIFLGFTWLSGALYESQEQFSDKYNLHDIEVLFPNGLDESDINEIKDIDGISDVEEVRYAFDYLKMDNNMYQAKITQISKDIDLLYVKEGRLPESNDEIAIDTHFSEKNDLKIGDPIFLGEFNDPAISVYNVMNINADVDNVDDFMEENDNSDDHKEREYKIVGIVVSPAYACNSAIIYGVSPIDSMSIDVHMYVGEDSFESMDYKFTTDLYVTCEETADVGDVQNKIQDVLKPIAESKGIELEKKIDSINEAIDAKLAEGQEKLNKGQAEIDNAQNQLSKAKEQIETAPAKLAEAKETLTNGETEINGAKTKLEDASIQIISGERQIADVEKEYDEKFNEWLSGYNQLEDIKCKFNEGLEEYNDKKCQLDGAKRDFAIVENTVELVHRLAIGIENGSINEYNYRDFLKEYDVENEIETTIRIIEKYKGTFNIESDYLFSIREVIRNAASNPSGTGFGKLEAIAVEGVINNVYSEIENAKSKLKEAQDELNVALDKIHEAEEEINHAQAKIDYGKTQLDEGRAQIDQKKQELERGKSEYERGKNLLKQKEDELEEGWKEYDENVKKLEEAKKSISEKESELNNAIDRLNNAKDEYHKKEASVKSGAFMDDAILGKAAFAVQTRTSLIFINSLNVISAIANKLRYSLAGLYLVIGLLVCYSAITRIIYAQLKAVGTKKALGFNTREITMYYLMYTGLSAIGGGILGVCIAFICESVLLNGIANTFPFDKYVIYWNPLDIVMVVALQIVLLEIITYMSSRMILKKRAIELLAEETPSYAKEHFYEKFKIWEKTSVLNKIIVNNFVKDKRRVIGTVIGIAGCTALIVTALTFSRDVQNSFVRQFRDYFHFNYVVYFDSNNENAVEEINTILKSKNIEAASARVMGGLINTPDAKKSATTIFIPESVNEYKRMFTIDVKESLGNEELYDGVWMNHAYKNYYKDDAGDAVSITTVFGDEKNITIDGYITSYLTSSVMLMSRDRYEKQFDEEFSSNAFLCNATSEEMAKVEKELLNVSGYIKTANYYEDCKYAFKMFGNLSNIMVLVYMILSIMMSILVLLNLLTQFIDEKKNELIIMMINGYAVKDAKKYIYSDTILLTVIGVIIGVVVGSIMGHISVSNFDSSMVEFYKLPDPISCVIGVVGACIFTFIMCLIALKKVDQLHF